MGGVNSEAVTNEASEHGPNSANGKTPAIPPHHSLVAADHVLLSDILNLTSDGGSFVVLYIRLLSAQLLLPDSHNVFDRFSGLEFVQLQKEQQSRSKGYGSVQ